MVYRMIKTNPNGETIDAYERKNNYAKSIKLASKCVGNDMTDA